MTAADPERAFDDTGGALDTISAPPSPEQVSGKFVQAGGVRIHYGEAGEGPPLICLHGTGPGASGWSNFSRNVDALSRRHRTILVDLPRFGRSDKVAIEGPRLTYLSGVIRAFMDALGIDRASLIGSSMGGQVALKLAIDSPERVDRLVVVGPAVMDHSVFTPMPTECLRLIAGYYKDGGPTLDKMRRLLHTLVYDPASVPEEVVQERYRASVEPEVLAANRGPRWARQPIDRELDRVLAPTLIVWGQDDRASALDHGLLMLKKLPDARLHVFARCGHQAQSEHAEEFNRLVLHFLAGGQADAPART